MTSGASERLQNAIRTSVGVGVIDVLGFEG